MNNESNNLYEFGEFRLDTKERVLLRENETIFLAPKVFDTLEILVKGDGKIISKDDLMNGIWEDSFVEEGNLTQNIYVLRQTLGKDCIETIPRRGYRFAADIKVILLEENSESFNRTNASGDVLIARRTRTQIIEEEFIEDSEKTPRTANRIGARAYLGIAAAMFTVLITGGFGFWFWNKNNPETAKTEFDQIQIQTLTNSGKVNSFAISPNGEILAYVKSGEEDGNSIYLKDLKLNQDVKIETIKNANPAFLTFSPGGDHIFFLNKGKRENPSDIYKITKFGGNPELVVEDIASEFSFSKDGNRIVFVRKDNQTNEHSLIIRDLETKEEKILTKKSFPGGFSTKTSPVWSDLEDKIYAVSQKQDSFFTELVKIDIETAEEELVPTPKWLKLIVAITKAPNKDELIMAARRNGEVSQIYSFDLVNEKLKSITNDINNYRKVSVSADGSKIVSLLVNNRSDLKLLTKGDFGNIKELTDNSFGRAGRHGLEVLQDGRILYVSIATKNREIWILDTKDSSKQQLTKDIDHPSQNPTSAPNGSYIYYVSAIKETRNIKRMNMDGQNQVDIVTEKDSNAIFPAVSPDEKTLYFIRLTKGNSEIWKKDLPDGKTEKLDIPAKIIPGGFLKISPGGKFLAFQQLEKTSDRTPDNLERINFGEINVGIISLDELSAKPKFFRIPTNRPTIRWTLTSDAFDFVENTSKGAIIKRQMISAESPPKVIMNIPRTELQDFLWMPNSDDLLISDRSTELDAILITNVD